MKNNNIKGKIMELLFNFPNGNFHIREISRKIKVSPSAILRAVKLLEKENIIVSNKKFLFNIRANLSNSRFKNLKRAYNLDSIYSSGLFDYLYENFSLSAIILFGSYSRGEDIERSDIDIAIEAKDKEIELEDYEKKLNRKINTEFINFGKISKELRDSIINGIVLSGYIRLDE